MSHGIQKRDTQAGLDMAWHGLTDVVEVVTVENAFPHVNEKGEADTAKHWDVEKGTLVLPNGKQSPFSVLLCTDDGEPIGKPFEDSYVASTIRQFWHSIVESLSGTDYAVHSAGSIFNRDKIFASVKIGNGFKIGERKFEGFLSFLDSFDKTMSLEASYSSTCVVCANTFKWAMADAARLMESGEGFTARAKHTKNFSVQVELMKVAIAGFAGIDGAFKKALASLASTPIVEDDARHFFAGFVAGEKDVLSTRAENMIERMVGLFTGGAGNEGKNLLDVFSAITDYYTHESAGNSQSKEAQDILKKQFLSSEFGQGRTRKEDGLRLLLNEDKLKAAIIAGKAVTLATEKAK